MLNVATACDFVCEQSIEHLWMSSYVKFECITSDEQIVSTKIEAPLPLRLQQYKFILWFNPS